MEWSEVVYFSALQIDIIYAGRIACICSLWRYVLSYEITVQPLAGEWTVIFLKKNI